MTTHFADERSFRWAVKWRPADGQPRATVRKIHDENHGSQLVELLPGPNHALKGFIGTAYHGCLSLISMGHHGVAVARGIRWFTGRTLAW